MKTKSDIGAVGAWRRGEHVGGTVTTQRGGTLKAGRQGKGDRRSFVVGVEAQTFPSITHVPRTVRVWRTGGAVVVVRTGVQLIQGDGGDVCSVHGESVASVAWEVREGVGSCHRADVLLRFIFLTAVILQ